jgi:hypothetical protein
MKTLLTILAFSLFTHTGSSQNKPTTLNKTKLAYLDSLLDVMQKQKNELALLLNDFLVESQNFEKSGDRSVKGKTINDRLTSVRDNALKRGKTAPTSKSFANMEKIASKIAMTQAEIEEQKKKWKDKKDSLSEMDEMDMLMLQRMMDKKNQLESMISNTMKAGYEGGQAAIQALKAS